MEPLLYSIFASAAVFAVIFYAWRRQTREKQLLATGANYIRLALVRRLERVYTNALDASDAALLTRAVIALLLGEQPEDAELVNYFAANRALIDKEAQRLLADPQVQRWLACAAEARNAETFLRLTREFYEGSAAEMA